MKCPKCGIDVAPESQFFEKTLRVLGDVAINIGGALLLNPIGLSGPPSPMLSAEENLPPEEYYCKNCGHHWTVKPKKK